MNSFTLRMEKRWKSVLGFVNLIPIAQLSDPFFQSLNVIRLMLLSPVSVFRGHDTATVSISNGKISLFPNESNSLGSSLRFTG